MTLDRDDADERLARLEKLMREGRAKPAIDAENPVPGDDKRPPKAPQAKAAGPPPGRAERRRSKRR